MVAFSTGLAYKKCVSFLGEQTCRIVDGLHPPLHPLHQAQRDKEGARLGTEEGGASGRVFGTEGKHQNSEGWIRLQETFRKVLA